MTVDYLPIANDAGANVVSQADYAIAVAPGGDLEDGYQSGLARSDLMNKTWRQSSVMTAALANAIAQVLAVNVLDDGDVTALKNQIVSMLAAGASFASATEVLTGTSTTKVVSPDTLAALWEKGGDIASAGTISIGEGGFFHITGTTGITDIDFATDKSGRGAWLVFDGILTLTHGANLILNNGGSNIITAAGDRMYVSSEGSDAVRCTLFRASGEAVSGASAFATATEVLTGTSTTVAVNPDALAALWEQGANIASAGTISIGEGGYFHVTGTTGITDIDFATDKTGRGAWLIFDGILTLTHSANLLLNNGGSNITTAVGDRMYVSSEGSDVVRATLFRANGQATSSVANSGTVQAWVNFNGTTGTASIRASGNVSSITDNASSDWTVNFTSALADADYTVASSGYSSSSSAYIITRNTLASPTTTACRIYATEFGGSPPGRTYVDFAAIR